MKKLIPFFSLLVTACCLFSCKKDNYPEREGSKLIKMITRTGPDSAGVTFFKYDNMERVISLKDSLLKPDGFESETVFQYDAAGNISQCKSFYKHLLYQHITDYTYNGGILTSGLHSTPHGNVERNTYNANAQNRILNDTVFNFSNSNFYRADFTYDANTNLTAWQHLSKASGTWQNLGSRINAEYSSIDNPFQKMGIHFYLTRPNSFELNRALLSKKLVTKVSSTNFSTTYTYEYQQNGLPKKLMIMEQFTGWSRTSTIEFFYE